MQGCPEKQSIEPITLKIGIELPFQEVTMLSPIVFYIPIVFLVLFETSTILN